MVPSRTPSTSRSELSSSREISTPGCARWNAASASNSGVTVQPMTMPTVSRPRIRSVTSPTAWPTAPAGGERGAGVFERGLARDGEGRGARRPVEQLGAELAFQLADLGADAGLADVHPLGRPGEVRLLGDRDEVFQLPQLHDWRF